VHGFDEVHSEVGISCSRVFMLSKFNNFTELHRSSSGNIDAHENLSFHFSFELASDEVL
jgi:hypothetical protein